MFLEKKLINIFGSETKLVFCMFVSEHGFEVGALR